MSKTIVITAHGKMDNINPIKLIKSFITTCKFGEVHSSKLVKFNELSIFTNPNLLYEYVFTGDDYSNQGELKYTGNIVPNIILTPLDSTQITKNWSWQKPYVENHLRKMCIYELKNIPDNNYNINFTNINQISLADVEKTAKSINFIPLLNHISLTNDYLINTNNYNGIQVDINNHLCSITSSTNNRIHIFDYEMGPSINGTILNTSDNWNILDAVTDIENFGLKNGIDLTGAESVIVKACLSL